MTCLCVDCAVCINRVHGAPTDASVEYRLGVSIVTGAAGSLRKTKFVEHLMRNVGSQSRDSLC